VTSNKTLAFSRYAGVAALLVTGAWCFPALASNGITGTFDQDSDTVPTAAVEAASPSLIETTNVPVHRIGETDDAESASKLGETSESLPTSVFIKNGKIGSGAKKPIENSRLEEMTIRSSGDSIVSLPLIRREMFRTDI
jgi:hypothetical protein